MVASLVTSVGAGLLVVPVKVASATSVSAAMDTTAAVTTTTTITIATTHATEHPGTFFC